MTRRGACALFSSGRLFQDNFANVGGIGGNPAEAPEIDFGSAVLRFCDDFGGSAKAFVTKLRFCNANAVNIAGRNAGCAAEADKKGVQIGTFATELSRFEHEADVSETAAAGLWISESVVHDPLIDGAGLFHVGVCASSDFAGGGFYNAIGGNKYCGAEEMSDGFGRLGLVFARSGKVDGEVASGDSVCGCNDGLCPFRELGRDDAERIVFGFD